MGWQRYSGFALPLLLLLLWQGLASAGVVQPMVLPSPLAVAERWWAALLPAQAYDAAQGSYWSWLFSGELPHDAAASLWRVLMGFLAGAIPALPLGLIMGASASAYALFNPLIQILRPIPPIAVIPLAILWFGIDELSKVFIIAYGAFFPILVNTLAGFREVERVQVRAAQALGANRYQVFRDVVLRSAFPFIIIGARLGMSMAFIVLVAAELIASSAGLGFMISDARYNFRTDQMFLGMACIGVLGFALNTLLLKLERSLLKWKPQ